MDGRAGQEISADGAAVASTNQQPTNARIAQEFQYLLEKSVQLFAGLRDLPPTGRHWQPYFHRTFEIYTRLWRFQQTHREALDNPEVYGLKRWEIGEIASKIGQLYYHYYLRTSETNYLYESYIFYEAIRDRLYFNEVLGTGNAALMVKKLRYYARFIVVCLLLNMNDMIKALIEELTLCIEQYTNTYRQPDSAEWNVVLSEIATFMEAERRLAPVDAEGNALRFLPRLQVQNSLRFDKEGNPKLKLQEAILVGNYANQITFSELTLDMYRMLLSLEREPSAVPGQGKTTGQLSVPVANPGDQSEQQQDDPQDKTAATRRTNPHKCLLHRPTFSQLFYYLTSSFKELTENSALLLYLSADGAKRATKSDQNSESYTGGIATAVNSNRRATDRVDPEQALLVNTLHPNDIVPLTRKPLFLVVDSTNSTAFKTFPKVFNQPFICLMSPTEYPSTVKDTTQIGGLFTLFLHAPLKGITFICDLNQINADVWSKSIEIADSAERAVVDLIDQDAALDKSFKRFSQDDFLRSFISRFVLCSALLTYHSAFKDAKHLPSSYPPLSASILTSPELIGKVRELVNALGVDALYSFPDSHAEPTSSG